MASNTSPAVGSPEWWLDRLLGTLNRQRPVLDRLDLYYRGEQPMPTIPDSDLATAYRDLLRRSRSNYMRVVIEACADRLAITGFRDPGEAEARDDTAVRVWENSDFETEHLLLIEAALVCGRSYVSVWPSDGGVGQLYSEDPRQTIVESVPGSRNRRAAAVKTWIDDWTGRLRATVYLPEGVYEYSTNGGAQSIPVYTVADPSDEESAILGVASAPAPGGWRLDREQENPYKVVPIIPIVNRSALMGGRDGLSEISDQLATQDRINETIFERGLAGWLAAFRQKYAIGVDVPLDPTTGKPVSAWRTAFDTLFTSTNENAKFGSFDATDTKAYLEAIEQDVQGLAVQTATPRHYFLQSGQAPSGDSMQSAEAGLIAKLYRKQLWMGRGLAEAMMLARGGETRPQVIWKNPEYRTLGELTDAVIKQYGAGLITLEYAQGQLGIAPEAIAEMADELKQRAFDKALTESLASAPAQTVDRTAGPDAAAA